MPKVVPIPNGPRKMGGGFGLPLSLAACVAIVATAAGFVGGAWVARWPQRIVEVPQLVDVPVPYPEVHEKTVPYEVNIYYPVKDSTFKGKCPSIAAALNMFEFLEKHGLPHK